MEDASTYAEREEMANVETSALDASNVNMAFECIIQGKWSCVVDSFSLELLDLIFLLFLLL